MLCLTVSPTILQKQQLCFIVTLNLNHRRQRERERFFDGLPTVLCLLKCYSSKVVRIPFRHITYQVMAGIEPAYFGTEFITQQRVSASAQCS
jgi:hypothetical protein